LRARRCVANCLFFAFLCFAPNCLFFPAQKNDDVSEETERR
jgi:hypothetical protein